MDIKKDEKNTEFKNKARVNLISERCKGCGFCIAFCPKKVLVFSKEYNEKGYHIPLVKNPQDCIGCNLCGFYCPDFAIWGEKEV